MYCSLDSSSPDSTWWHSCCSRQIVHAVHSWHSHVVDCIATSWKWPFPKHSIEAFPLWVVVFRPKRPSAKEGSNRLYRKECKCRLGEHIENDDCIVRCCLDNDQKIILYMYHVPLYLSRGGEMRAFGAEEGSTEMT